MTRRIDVRISPWGCLLWVFVFAVIAAAPPLIVLLWKEVLT